MSIRHQAAYVALVANTHWPQARQARHDPTKPSLCQLCQAAAGTLWHRRYECPASEGRRRQYTSPQLRKAAQHAQQCSPYHGEMFARGIFPDVMAELPPPLQADRAQIHWVNRPASGRMSGTLFSDGSGMFPEWPQLRRAGWAVVQVDRLGNLTAAAYGAVPLDIGPQQVARDGEDYAAFMCTVLAEPPFCLYVDCEGTLECLRWQGALAKGADNPRAHLWTKYWAQFAGEDVASQKTLAHATEADIEQGRSTYWERRANGHADRLAKRGAADHGLTDLHVEHFLGLAQIAKEAARWAGEQEAWLQERELRDSTPLTGHQAKPRQELHRRKSAAAESMRGHHQHTVRAADLVDGGFVVF